MMLKPKLTKNNS